MSFCLLPITLPVLFFYFDELQKHQKPSAASLVHSLKAAKRPTVFKPFFFLFFGGEIPLREVFRDVPLADHALEVYSLAALVKEVNLKTRFFSFIHKIKVLPGFFTWFGNSASELNVLNL